ncbi:MAG: hypothetical protein WCC69_08375 [Pirellulales bacterium]
MRCPTLRAVDRRMMWEMLAVAIACGCGCVLLANAGPPPTESRSSEPADAPVHERYAAARLRLAELKVARAEDLNRRMPGLLTQTDMRRLHNRVALLREQLDATQRAPHGNAVDQQEAAARVRVQIAADDLEAARAVRARNPAAVSDNELRQLEVKCEIARLRLELWSDPSFRQSPIEVMQMQIDQITDFVVDAVDSIDGAPAIQRR